tara:strand:- start:13180 stop:13893 length:714 start_codon:yes stop_codon:yes gene_type:complete
MKVRFSKSKKGLYDFCPYAYKLCYVDGKKEKYREYYDIGSNVHDFVETYFKKVKIRNGSLILPFSVVDIKGRDENYKKNFLKFEIKRWERCRKTKPNNPEKYYLPLISEEKIEVGRLDLVGIPDRLHINFSDELVIVDVKTGYPTLSKRRWYKVDLFWYKLLLEESGKVNKTINKGTIYYPYNNHIDNYNINQQEMDEFKEAIFTTRKRVVEGMFPPNLKSCGDCGFRRWCKYVDFK